MSKSDSEYGFQKGKLTRRLHMEYVKESVELADPNIEFSQYDIVYIVPSRNAVNITYSPTFVGGKRSSIMADGKIIATQLHLEEICGAGVLRC